MEDLPQSVQLLLASMQENISQLTTRVAELESQAVSEPAKPRPPEDPKTSTKTSRDELSSRENCSAATAVAALSTRKSKHKERKEEKLEQQAVMMKQLVKSEVTEAVSALGLSETTSEASQKVQRETAQHATAEMLEQLGVLLTSASDEHVACPGLTPRCVELWSKQAAQIAQLPGAEDRIAKLLGTCVSQQMLTEHKEQNHQLLKAREEKREEQDQRAYDKLENMKRTVEHLVIKSQQSEDGIKVVIDPLEVMGLVEASLEQLAINRTSDISLWQLDQKADRTYCEQLFESLASQVAEALDQLEHNKIAALDVGMQQVRNKLCLRPIAPDMQPTREGPIVGARRCRATKGRAQGRAQELHKLPQTARQWMPDRLPDPHEPNLSNTSGSSKFRPKSCSQKHLKMAVLPTSPTVL